MRRLTIVAVLIASALAGASCGGGEKSSGTTDTTVAETTTDEITTEETTTDASGGLASGGEQIWFFGLRDGIEGTYVMNADGTEQRRLGVQHGSWPYHGITWSPDGLKIAYTRGGEFDTSDEYNHLYVSNADGSEEQRVGGRDPKCKRDVWDQSPMWSPDSTKIVFVQNCTFVPGLPADIHVVNADGSGNRNFTRSPSDYRGPSWSPDGARIIFSKEGAVYVMNADGSGRRNLTPDQERGASPAWSPDGDRIVFLRGSTYSREIYVMNADGSGQQNLTRNQGRYENPRWSPDGRKLVFVDDTDIYVMNADGSGRQKLAENPEHQSIDPAPEWSSDGERIAFVREDRDGRGKIYVMNADGSAQRNLTRNAEYDWSPHWVPMAEQD